jgi:long-chain acyl-CoA synthetase
LKKEGLIVMSEQELYDSLYQSIIVDDKISFLGQILQRAAHKCPHTIALICKDRQVPYRELYYYASQLSITLRNRGIKPRDRILLFFENSIEFYIAYFGILQIGAVVCPLNTFLREHELSHILDDAQPTLIISSTKLLHRLKENEIKKLPPILTEEDMVVEGAAPNDFSDISIDMLPVDEMAALLYTSGTTGLPKGVMLSSRNALINVIQSAARFNFVGYERVFAVLPLFHSLAQNTCVWAVVLMCCTAIIVPHIERRSIIEGLAHKPTVFLGVPALYAILSLMKNAPLSSIKYFFSGGDALPDRIRAAFSLIYRRKLCGGYGLTETSPVVTLDMDDVLEATDTVGKPVIGVEVLIKDEKGITLPQGQVGEVLIKGENVMLGYYRAPELTKDVLVSGWLRTGDLGYFDPKGKLVISGRLKDLIIHKGLNIYPQEIENIIVTYPNVLLVGVIGKPDELSGEVPIAFVQIKEDEPNIEQKLRALCVQHLAAYKVPRQFICSTKRLPVTAMGKVDKKVLKSQLHEQKTGS